jgi:hypothetical protein
MERHNCPACGHPIVWALNNFRSNAIAEIKCTKSPTASRVELILETETLCMWTGIAQRQKDGSVRLFLSDGVTLLRKEL